MNAGLPGADDNAECADDVGDGLPARRSDSRGTCIRGVGRPNAYGAAAEHPPRAHWHHFWTGPRDGERRLVLRWLHPILVAGGQIVPVVRTVD